MPAASAAVTRNDGRRGTPGAVDVEMLDVLVKGLGWWENRHTGSGLLHKLAYFDQSNEESVRLAASHRQTI
jgi:hypothetical protein